MSEHDPWNDAEAAEQESALERIRIRQLTDQAERMAVVADYETEEEDPRARRWPYWLGGVLVVLLVLVLVAPMAAGPIFKPRLERAISDATGSPARIGGVHLSWFGSQRLTDLVIVDASLSELVRVSAEADRSLLGLLKDSTDLGTIRLVGSARLAQRPDGSYAPLPPPDPEASGEPFRLPIGRKATLELAGFDLAVADLDGSAAVIDDATGTIALDTTGDGDAVVAVSAVAGQPAFKGPVTIDLASSGFLSRDGSLAVGVARLEGRVEAGRFPLGLLEPWLGATVESLGETAAVRAEVDVLGGTGTGRLSIESDGAAAELPVSIARVGDEQRVTLGEGGRVRLEPDAVGAWAPALRALTREPIPTETGAAFQLAAVPGLTLDVTRLVLPLASGGAAVRWEDASFSLSVTADEFLGTLDGTPWAIEPLTLHGSARTLGDGVRVSGATTSTLGGDLAGVLAVALRNARPIDADGAWRTGPAEILGPGRLDFEVNDVRSAVVGPLLDPLLAAANLTVTRDLGETFAVELSYGGSPEPALFLDIESERVHARAGLRIDDGRLLSDAGGLTFRADDVGPLVTAWLGRAGVRIGPGASAEARLRELTVDLSAFDASEPGRNLAAYSGRLDVDLGATTAVVTASDGTEQTVRFAPASLQIDLRDIASGISAAFSTTATVEGSGGGPAPAELAVSLVATELLAADGSLRAGVPPVVGEVGVRNVPSALLAPWLPRAAGDVLASAGERLTLTADARANASGVVTIDADVRGGRLHGEGAFEIDRGVLRTGEGGARLLLTEASGSVAAVVPSLAKVDDGGSLTLRVSSARFGARDGAAVAPELVGEFELLDAAWRGASGEPFAIERANAAFSLRPGDEPAVELNAFASYAEQPMVAAGRFGLPGLLGGTGSVELFGARPDGRLDLTGAPVGMLGLLIDLTGGDPRPLLRDLIGQTADAEIVAERGAIAMRLTGSGGSLVAESAANMGGGSLRIGETTVAVRVDPEVLRQARLREIAGGSTAPTGPVLAAPAVLNLSLGGFTLAEMGRLAPSGDPPFRLTASVLLTNEDAPRPLFRQLGVDGFELAGTLPMGALLGGQRSTLDLTMDGTLIGDGESAFAVLDGTAAVDIAAGTIDGDLAVNADLAATDLGALDDALLNEGLLAGLFGARGEFTVALAGVAEGGVIRDASFEAIADSPRLSMPSPLRLSIRPDRWAIETPSEIAWDADPVFATRHLLGQTPGEETARIAEPWAVRVSIDRLSIGRPWSGESEGLFQPGLFDLHAAFAADALVLEYQAELGSAAPDLAEPVWGTTAYRPIAGELSRTDDGSLRMLLSATSDSGDAVALDATLIGFADAAGRLDLPSATADALLEAKGVPMPVIDAFIASDGLLTELIGPAVNARLHAQSFHASGGKLNVSLTGERASARVIGEVSDGVFRSTEPAAAEVSAIREQLGRRLSRAVPVVGAITKPVEEGPATITISSIELPLDRANPVEGLNADFRIDVGTAHFSTSRLFGNLVRAVGGEAQGVVGRRLEPVTGRIRNGSLAYDRFTLPLGEFNVLSQGSYHLVTKSVSVTTHIPVGALTDEALGILNTGLGAQIGRLLPGLERATMIPWKVSGRPGALRVEPDLEALVRDLGSLLNPINLFDGVRRGLGLGG